MKHPYKSILLPLLLCLMITEVAFAQNKVGTTAAPFLGIAIGPRAQAMGSAFVAMDNDITVAYWNPGALSMVEKSGAMFSHTNWHLGTSFNWIGLNLNLGNGYAVGVNLTQLDYGREEITTITAQEGTGRYWDAQDMAVGVSMAKALTTRFSLGGTVKYINQRIWNESATALAIDVGLLFRTNFNNLRLGMSISNYGNDMRLTGDDLLNRIDIDPENAGSNKTLVANMKTEAYALPIFFRIGVAYDFFQSLESNRLTVAIDAIHPTDNVEYVNLGAEYSWSELVSLRAGYKTLFMPDAQEGLTLGAGLRYDLSNVGALKIDYAFQEFKDLGDVQTFAFSFLF